MPHGLNIEKPASLIGIGEHTCFVLTEHTVTVLGDIAVSNIAQSTRDDLNYRRQNTPMTAQLATGSQDGVRSL